MSKSKGEFLRVKTLIDKGYSPLDYRYLCLGTHYRKRLLFSWDLLDQAKVTFGRLKQNIQTIRDDVKKNSDPRDATMPEDIKAKFTEAVNDDLNMPQALAVLWGVIRNDKLSSIEKMNLVNDFNRVLGLDLDKDIEAGNTNVPAEIMELVEKRIAAKKAKDFKKADALRDELKALGWEVLDKKDGVEVKQVTG
jgi:cysteinyl-tRNA synthetase